MKINRHPDRGTQPNNAQPLRIALYSHDTCGLGHMRRNLLIAEALVEQFPDANILLITGAREVAAFQFPDRVDTVSLPSLFKEANDVYSARSFALDIAEVIHIRSSIIKASIEVFNPDVFIVDKVPRGTKGELDETLKYLSIHPETKCVLGLRDVLDNTEVTEAEWKAAGNTVTVNQCYDAVWVYGDKRVFDFFAAYDFSNKIGRKIAYTGYLDPSIRMRKTDPNKRTQDLLKQVGSRFYLCTVGGGQDGAVLATAFVNAEFPEGVNGLVVTGPHMPNEDIKSLLQIVDVNPHLKLVKFLSEPLHIYSAAERIVSMGGYNTTLELVGLGANALLVPRVQPREEQWIRSQALQSLGLLDHLHPQQLTPAYLSHWFKTPFKRAAAREVIDMEGYFRIPELLRRLLKHNQESQKKFPAPIHHALT